MGSTPVSILAKNAGVRGKGGSWGWTTPRKLVAWFEAQSREKAAQEPEPQRCLSDTSTSGLKSKGLHDEQQKRVAEPPF